FLGRVVRSLQNDRADSRRAGQRIRRQGKGGQGQHRRTPVDRHPIRHSRGSHAFDFQIRRGGRTSHRPAQQARPQGESRQGHRLTSNGGRDAMPFIVTPRQLIQRSELYSQLASLLTAGVALVQALEMIQRKPPAYSFRRPLSAIIANIQAGTSFAESLSSLGRWIPSFDLALIQAAEQSGPLAESMRLLADYYQQRAQFANSFMGQVAYPFFLVHLALVIFPSILIHRLVWVGHVLTLLPWNMF